MIEKDALPDNSRMLRCVLGDHRYRMQCSTVKSHLSSADDLYILVISCPCTYCGIVKSIECRCDARTVQSMSDPLKAYLMDGSDRARDEYAAALYGIASAAIVEKDIVRPIFPAPDGERTLL